MRSEVEKTDTKQEPATEGVFFLDSGAHSLYNREVFNKPEIMALPLAARYEWFKTKEFWDYVDAYAAFVKKHKDAIDYYANVDVIYCPELSWKVQRYLEREHELTPVPVIHWGADMAWVDRHLNAGYEFIGIGGLGQGVTKGQYYAWADKLFDRICQPPSHLPIVRTHGFAMTAYDLLLRWPWWSVDSASWTKMGAFGSIAVPHRRDGKFVFTTQPYQVVTSLESPETKVVGGKHINALRARERHTVLAWLDEIGVPLGKGVKEGDPDYEMGVTNHHSQRKIANLLFFEAMRKALPPYPWPFRPEGRIKRGSMELF